MSQERQISGSGSEVEAPALAVGHRARVLCGLAIGRSGRLVSSTGSSFVLELPDGTRLLLAAESLESLEGQAFVPQWDQLKHSSTVRRPLRENREIRELFHSGVRAALGDLEQGCEIFGVTKGQFSLMDLVCDVLSQTGPAHVVISTWTAAHADLKNAWRFMRRGDILSCRWLIDRSFRARQPEYCAELLRRFGVENIRGTMTHAKFVCIFNDDWTLAIRTSMNLNQNPRFEHFELSDDPTLCGWLVTLTEAIFDSQALGHAFEASSLEHFGSFELEGDTETGRGIFLPPLDFDL